jgi:Protein of unknown function (DUF3421)
LGKKALRGGQDSDGSPIYVGRASHNGIFLPAKILPSKFACYVGELIESLSTKNPNKSIF